MNSRDIEMAVEAAQVFRTQQPHVQAIHKDNRFHFVFPETPSPEEDFEYCVLFSYLRISGFDVKDNLKREAVHTEDGRIAYRLAYAEVST